VRGPAFLCLTPVESYSLRKEELVSVAAIVLVIGCIAYAVWHRGQDWFGITLGAALGVAIAGTAIGQMLTALLNALGSAGSDVMASIFS
jgi:hypothetical protein